MLDASGHPVTTWWPVAFALRRIEDTRAQPALLELLRRPGKYTVAFAARGLGATKDPRGRGAAVALVDVAADAARGRGLGRPRARSRSATPRGRAADRSRPSTAVDPNVRLEAVTALGALRAADGLPDRQDFLTDRGRRCASAALRAAAAIDPEASCCVLSGMEPDTQWIVRAALAEVLGDVARRGRDSSACGRC